MSLPYYDMTPGAEHQAPLAAAGQKLGATICYEDAYGSEQLAVLGEATLLVNVTNNAWFGDSAAPHQQLQMARFRAREAGRSLIRSTSNGITAVISPDGSIKARAPQFVPAVLKSSVQPMTGLTPYARTGNWPVLLGCLLMADGMYRLSFPAAPPATLTHERTLRTRRNRVRRPARMGGRGHLCRARGSGAAEVLLPVHVPVPERPPAHGPRAQLHDRRRACALHAHAGLQRAAADGLGRLRPAGGERRDRERRRAGALDPRQHRLHEEPAEVARLRHRLVARARDLRRGLLPLEPVAVPAHARARHRLQDDRRRQLGSGGPDGARERAGHRRARLAHGRADREARDPDVLPADHAVRGGAAAAPRRARRTGRNACA